MKNAAEPSCGAGEQGSKLLLKPRGAGASCRPAPAPHRHQRGQGLTTSNGLPAMASLAGQAPCKMELKWSSEH